ncbi:MAG: helix-turn-helix transcriptional regulator [Mycetocola sp.]
MRASANETLAQLALNEDDFDACLHFSAAALDAIRELRADPAQPGEDATLDVGEIEGNAVCWSALATWQPGRGAGGLKRINALISTASEAGLLAEHGILFLTRGFIRRQQLRLAEAIADLEAGIALTDLGRPELAPYGRIELALALFRNGEWDAAATAAAAAASLAEDVQNPWLHLTGYAIAAVVPAARGDRATAEAWLAEAEAGPESLRSGSLRRLALFARVLEARAAGDTATVVALCRRAIAADPENSQIERSWWVELLEEARRPSSPVRNADPLAVLSSREREVAHLAAQGMTNREVAQKLFVSVKGVEYHMGNVLAKLGIASRRGIRSMIEGN